MKQRPPLTASKNECDCEAGQHENSTDELLGRGTQIYTIFISEYLLLEEGGNLSNIIY